MKTIITGLLATTVLLGVGASVYAQATYGTKCVRNGNTTTCTPCKMPYC